MFLFITYKKDIKVCKICFVLKNCDFDACLMHMPLACLHLTHQNLSARALFFHNSPAKVNTQLSIHNEDTSWGNLACFRGVKHFFSPETYSNYMSALN